MSFSQLRPLGIGEILDGAFTLYRRQFASMFLTALLPQLPVVALSGVYAYAILGSMDPARIASGAAPGFSPVALVLLVILIPLAIAGFALATGAVTFQISRAYTGSPVTTNEALRRGMGQILPLIGANIVFFLVVAVGFMLCIVPGILAAIAGFAFVPAVVLERRGPIDSIQRSWELARGAWGEIFLVMLIAYMIAALPGSAVGGAAMVGGIALSSTNPGAALAVQAGAQVLSALIRTLVIPFSIGCTVLMYYDRRVRTEALDVQMMAESLNVPAPAPTPYGTPPGTGPAPETPRWG